MEKEFAGAWRMDVDVDLVDSDNMTGEVDGSDSSVIEEKSNTSLDFGTDSSESEREWLGLVRYIVNEN